MPMRMALQRCPEAIVIKGNSMTYSRYSKLVTEVIAESVPLYEKSSIDEFYLDLTGMDQFYGCMQYTQELRYRILNEIGLPISFGLSENKTVSKIATGEAKPNNAKNIDYGTEKKFLAPLPVKKIPSVGLKTYQTLCNLGVKHIKTLQMMPEDLLEQTFGKHGKTIWLKGNGIDPSPVVQYNERKSISTERTFERDTIDIRRLKAILSAMAENLSFQLRRANKVTGCIAVKIRYADFQTKTLQKKLPYSAADHVIIPLVLDLFEKLYQRRVRIRLIGVRFSELVTGAHQMNLFEEDTKYANLYQALDKIRQRYGDRSVVRAMGLEAKTIGRKNPFDGEPPALLANRKQ
jgi:DNA polymerase-4